MSIGSSKNFLKQDGPGWFLVRSDSIHGAFQNMSLDSIDAVFFDLDGVLVNSLRAWFSAFNDTLEKFDKDPLSKEQFERDCWGTELGVNMDRLGLGSEGTEFCQAKYIDYLDRVEIFPGVKDVLGSIDSKIGLVTSTPADPTFKILKRFDLEKYFDVIITRDDVENPKPDPEPLLKACDALEVDPKKAVFVGDNESDMTAGKAAGCTVIGLGVDGDVEISNLSELRELSDSHDW